MTNKNFDLDIQYLLGQNIDESYYTKTRKKDNKKSAIISNQFKLIKCGKSCPLFKRAKSPQMNPFGSGRLRIAGIGESPGRVEDIKNRPFVGNSGTFLKKAFKNFDIDMDVDLQLFNLVQCRPLPPVVEKANQFPSRNIALSCIQQRLHKQLLEYKPKLIIGFGENVFNYMLDSAESKRVDINWKSARKNVFWSNKYNCPIGFVYHPSYVIRNGSTEAMTHFYYAELGHVLDVGSREFPSIDFESGNILITDFKKLCKLLRSWINNENLPAFSFDFETNDLSPYLETAKIIFISISFSPEKGYGFPLDFPAQGEFWSGWTDRQRKEIISLFQQLMQHKTLKIAQKSKFETRWVLRHIGVWPENLLHDTMHTQHLLDERKSLTGLKTQVYMLTGKVYDTEIDASRLETYPLKIVAKYGILDSRTTKMIQKWQYNLMDSHLKRGHTLQEQVLSVFARMEERGIKVDIVELERQEKQAQLKIKKLKEKCEDLFGKRYYAQEGSRLNINSSEQLATLLYSIIKLEYKGRKTATNRYKADEGSLKELRDRVKNKKIREFIDTVLECKQTAKFRGTYLQGWKKYLDSENLLHPYFDLMTGTIRSNSHDPNLQNVPKRNEAQKKVRKCIVPKFDKFLEADGKAMEMAVMAMLSRDKRLIKEVRGEVDIHMKWAAKIFETTASRVEKKDRDFVKSNFVFPRCYGSQDDSICGYFKTGGYDIPDKHIIRCIRAIEKDYIDLFEWQERMKHQYKTKGYIEMPTGFRRRLNKNNMMLEEKEVVNTPVQHCATWIMFGGMVEIDKIMLGEKFTGGMNIEVHDATTFDLPDNEIMDVYEIADKELMKNRWDWMLDVPIKAEWSIGSDWYNMEDI